MRRSEYLVTINVPAGEQSGNLLWDTKLAPRLFEGTRLAQMSYLYDKVMVKSFALEVTSAAPTTVSGSYMACIDPSAETEYLNYTANQLIRVMSNTPGSRSATLSASMDGRMMVNLATKPNEWLYTDLTTQDLYKTHFGSAALAVYATTGGYTGQVALTVKMHYDVVFSAPSLTFAETSNTPIVNWVVPYPAGLVVAGKNPYNSSQGCMYAPESSYPVGIPEEGSVYQITEGSMSQPSWFSTVFAPNSGTFFRANKGYSNLVPMTLHFSLEDARMSVNALSLTDLVTTITQAGGTLGGALAEPWYITLTLASPAARSAPSRSSDSVKDLTRMVLLLSDDLARLQTAQTTSPLTSSQGEEQSTSSQPSIRSNWLMKSPPLRPSQPSKLSQRMSASLGTLECPTTSESHSRSSGSNTGERTNVLTKLMQAKIARYERKLAILAELDETGTEESDSDQSLTEL